MKKKFIVFMALASLLFATIPFTASAVSPASQLAVCGTGASNFFGFQPWYACLQDANGTVVFDDLSDIFLIVFPVVEWLVKAGALVAAGIIFLMLIQMMLARGDSGKIATAAMGIRDAIIGLIISIAAVAIVNFIAGAFIP